MDRKTALQIKTELIEFAKKHGLWAEIHEARKPDLKNITVTVSILVTEKGITS